MNKKLSRIAAIALSAAMVTSAFAMSTSSAFAATAATASIDTLKVGLTTADATTNVYTIESDASKYTTGSTTSKVPKITVAGIDYPATGLEWESEWTSSNASVAEVDAATGKVTVKDANRSADQDVTFTRQLKVKATAESDKHAKSYERTAVVPVAVTAHVYDTGVTYVLPGAAPTVGAYASSSATIAANEGIAVQAYTVTNNGAAATGLAGTAKFTPSTTSYKYVSSNNNIGLKSGVAGATGDSIKAQPASNVNVGDTTISLKDATDKVVTDNVKNAVVSVADTYKVNTADENAITAASIYGVGGKTTLTSTLDANQTDNVYTINGKKVETTGANPVVLAIPDGAVIGNITATNNDGDTVNVKGQTGAITAKKVNVSTDAAAVAPTVSTGDITADVVEVSGTDTKSTKVDKYINIKTGNIKASTAGVTTSVTVAAPEHTIVANSKYEAGSKVEIGTITSNGAISLAAGEHVNSLTTGSISGVKGPYDDCPYSAKLTVVGAALKLGNLPFIGEVNIGDGNVTTDATVGTIDTGVKEATAFVAGCNVTSTSKLKVTAKAKLTATKVTVSEVDSTSVGTIVVPANSLEIKTNNTTPTATSATLIVSDATVGSVLYKSNANAQGLFKMPGITSVEGTGDAQSVYTYVAKALTLQGIKANQTSIEVGKTAKTISVSTVPNVSLPTGVTVLWKADKNTVKLTPSADGMSCTVEATGYTENNIDGSNNVNVTATLMKDGSIYSEVTTPMVSATTAVTLTNAAEVAPVLTTKVTDLDGKTTAVTADTVVKMTQSTYNTVDFAADKAGIADIKYGTGDGAKAQTGTTSAWNGTAGKYTIYASGKVGDKVGVFANGVKVFQIEIVDRPFKCDTTLDLDGVKGKALTVGQKYSFKITPADGTKIDTFTFLTANDSAVASWGFVKNADGTVTATIKALKATDKIGVYAKINGVTYKVFAAAVK